MKIIEKAIMPNGTEIQLEDWSKDYPGTCGLTIAAYPIAKNTSKYRWVKSGEKFRLDISMNKYSGYTNENVKVDFEALKNGEKQLEDLAEHFYNGKKDMFYLGMLQPWEYEEH